MKIRIDRDVMAEAVAWAARSLPSRPSVPILAGLLITAKSNEVTMSSFDYETSAKVTVAAQVIDEGQVLVSGRLLAEIARNLPNRPVDFTTDVHRAELVCGSARFTLQTLPIDDYPELPQMPTATGQVDSQLFTEAVQQVVIAAGKNEMLPVFTGVRMEIAGDQLSFLATDRYRMALKEVTWQPASPDASGACLVPARVLAEAARSITGGENVTIALSDPELGEGIIGLAGEDGSCVKQLTTRLLSGEFPKVRHLMDINATVLVRCSTQELVASAKRVGLVAERNTPMRMLITDDQIALEAASGDQAQASEAISAEVANLAGDEMVLSAAGFNPPYLSEALNAMQEPFVQFAFIAPGKPCLLQGLTDLEADPSTDYKHVIMLMRLPE